MKVYLVGLLALLPLAAGFAFHEAGWPARARATAPAASGPGFAVGRSVIPRDVRLHQARHWRALLLQPTR